MQALAECTIVSKLKVVWIEIDCYRSLIIMTTLVQPSAGQQRFLSPGHGAASQFVMAPMPAITVPGRVTPYHLYEPQMAGETGVTMVSDYQPPKYEYTPNDFVVLSLVTVILCGIFSPLSLVLSLPALFFSQQVSAHAATNRLMV